jgi:hypothetical protein
MFMERILQIYSSILFFDWSIQFIGSLVCAYFGLLWGVIWCTVYVWWKKYLPGALIIIWYRYRYRDLHDRAYYNLLVTCLLWINRINCMYIAQSNRLHVIIWNPCKYYVYFGIAQTCCLNFIDRCNLFHVLSAVN